MTTLLPVVGENVDCETKQMNREYERPNSSLLVPVPDGCMFFIGTFHPAKGRGLFAKMDIPPSTTIHVAPCIPVMKDEYDIYMKHTVMEHYLFNDVRSGNKLLALGYGSLFNHSNHPNVGYSVNHTLQTIEYRSGFQVISEGTELCISYGSKLWFENAEQSSTLDNLSDEEDVDADATTTFLQRINIDD
jgi:SET domain-containing protein